MTHYTRMFQNDHRSNVWSFSWPLLRPRSRPLPALLLMQTLRHGACEGCKIALIPLVTDSPIILVALFVASRVAELRPWLSIVSIAGGAW